MNSNRYGKFQSGWDFIDKFSKLFKGPYGSSKVLDKVFQEKIRITVTFANNCLFWGNARSAVGRKLGLSDDEISKLASIPKSDFEYREWTALNYARDFATLGGKEPTGEGLEEYYRLYSEKEQKHILKIARQMDFINRLMSTITRKNPADTCNISFENW